MSKGAILAKLKKELTKLKKNGKIIAVITKSNLHNDVIDLSTQVLTRAYKKNGIYVTTALPYDQLLPRLKKAKADTGRIFFIDGISRKSHANLANDSNCTYLQGPESLTEISLAITTAANTGKFEFLIFDSLSTLITYNKVTMVEKFSNFLLSKIKNLNFSGIVLLLDEETAKQILPSIGHFCDSQIVIKE